MAIMYDEDANSSSKDDTSHPTDSAEEERDEVDEIRKMSSKETARVQTWRRAVTLILLMTGVAVTCATYYFLEREEDNNFKTAFNQFSRTVADSAIEQQRNVRDAIEALSSSITASAQVDNATWPFFYMPLFENYAHDFLKRSRAEFVGINNIVYHKYRDQYIDYINKHYQEWFEQSHLLAYGNLDLLDTDTGNYNPFISSKVDDVWQEDIERDVYFVRTTQSPPLQTYGPNTNWNTATGGTIGGAMETLVELRNETIISEVRPFLALSPEVHARFHTDSEADNPHSFAYHPIKEDMYDDDSEIVATITAAIAWDASMLNLLPRNVKGMFCVVKNNCNQTYSYEIDGNDAFYRGNADFHDPKYHDLEVHVDLSLHTHPNFTSTPGHCLYSMSIYPTDRFKATYETKTPEVFAAFVAGTFLAIALVFFIYDLVVQKRNLKLMYNAAKSNAVVSSLFPGAIRDRVLNQKSVSSTNGKNNRTLKTFLSAENSYDHDLDLESKPLADLFLDCSVMFADIVGFTAWSSVREPSQVFTLLESVYSAFDEIAKRRRVFKVETVGDCYVAATGIPSPRADHAVVMARFAQDCMIAMNRVCKGLEVTLGPDTGDLSIRIGIHSGPVTAGVLRGERARFQLFGDTMNTCSRIENVSGRNRICVSQETADLLIKAGKEAWLQKREKVSAKGLGEIQTYWLRVARTGENGGDSSNEGSNNGMMEWEDAAWGETELHVAENGHGDSLFSDKMGRLIDWNAEMLLRLLKQIVARRNAAFGNQDVNTAPIYQLQQDYVMPLEEVKEIITLPEFDSKAAQRQQDPETVDIPQDVVDQLKDLVTCIASLYRGNAFHNFDHASHVVMSVIKLMSRIVAPAHLLDADNDKSEKEASRGSGSVTTKRKKDVAATLHDHTYGITSDPLTQFACAFSALIHDVDHTGVPNPQLIKENSKLAFVYKGRSVAEQNSFDLSWNLLMDDRYQELRYVLFGGQADLLRFRQLVVNSVMATDLGDKELKALRNARWDRAFKPEQSTSTAVPVEVGGPESSKSRDVVNRKATIVIEHLIQASDVAHTMQHWHVYRQWNERLFREMYSAYSAGRSDKNPADFWYEGEIGFLDFYVIPLAKKLKDCGVFGVSSDEYLGYAMRNREEWEARGREVVAEMMEKFGSKGYINV